MKKSNKLERRRRGKRNSQRNETKRNNTIQFLKQAQQYLSLSPPNEDDVDLNRNIKPFRARLDERVTVGGHLPGVMMWAFRTTWSTTMTTLASCFIVLLTAPSSATTPSQAAQMLASPSSSPWASELTPSPNPNRVFLSERVHFLSC